MRTKNYTCSECGEKYTSKVKLGEHAKQHVKTRTVKRPGKRTPPAKARVIHKCTICEEVFSSLVLLKKHKSSCEAAAKTKPVKKRKSAYVEASTGSVSKAIDNSKEASCGKLLEDRVHKSLSEVQASKDSNSNSQDSSEIGKSPPASKGAKSTENNTSTTVTYSANTAAGTSKRTLVEHLKLTSNVQKKGLKEASKTKSESQTVVSASHVKTRKTTSKLLKSAVREDKISAECKTKQRNFVQQKLRFPVKATEKDGLGKSLEKEGSVGISHDANQKSSRPLSEQNTVDVSTNQTLVVGKSKRKAPAERKEPAAKKVRKKKVLPKAAAKNVNIQLNTPVEEVINILISPPEVKEDSKDNQQTDESQSIPTADFMTKLDDDDFDDDDDDDSSTYELINVMKKVPPSEMKYVCAVCSKVFSKKYHLDRHLKLSRCSGLPPQSFPCHMCTRVYTRKDNLREHLRAHTGEVKRKKNHKCTFCDKAFHGQSLLMIHLRKHTGEKPFDCEFCPKKFPSAGALSKHRRTHTGEKPFLCTDCGQRFSLKGTLNRHLRVHSGVRPHVCTYCGKQFIQIGGLKAHLFYHTGENGFKCEDCGKVFNRKARLQMHKLFVHEKHRPFSCEQCKKSFTRKEDLSRHVILHTGEKPFKCPTCGKSFAIKPSLKLHLLTHTKEEPRSCHECGRAFIRKDCFLRHMRKRHRDLLDKLLVDEADEAVPEPKGINARLRSEEDLCGNIQELLGLLVDKITLSGLGWPDKPIDDVLEAVIKRCGHTPVDASQYSYLDRMRENAKLLFTVVIDDNAVKTLLNNLTVDEVILHVLRLAKT